MNGSAKRKKGRTGQRKKKSSLKPSSDGAGRKQRGPEMENEMRLDRVRELKEAVRNGTYRIDANKVAEQMLFELWDDLNRIDKN